VFRISLFLALATAGLGGCSSVTVTEPIGEPAGDDVTAKLAGVWQVSDKAQTLHIHALSDSRLALAHIAWEEGAFKLNTMRALVTAEQDALYVHLHAPPESPESTDGADPAERAVSDGYNFLRLTLDHDAGSLVVFGPRVEHYAEAVEAGELTGTVKRDGRVITVRLTGDAAELNAYFDPATVGEQFHVDNPLTLHRLGPRSGVVSEKE
jgi:hypothetical protein